jgi:predicted nucleic acid-binding protein
MRILFDTDVILDLVLEREPYVAAAVELMEFSAGGTDQGFISGITPVNVFYIGRKTVGADRARLAIADLLRTVEVCAVTHSTLMGALTPSFNDYEDAVQHACAVENGLDAIITRNVRDYKNATVPVFTPADFLLHRKQQQQEST